MESPSGGVGTAPPPPIKPSSDNSANADANASPGPSRLAVQATNPVIGSTGNSDTSSAAARDKGKDHNASMSQPKASSTTCIPKASERTKIDLPNE